MTKPYYELHITMTGQPALVKPHVENIGWIFSAIDGDPTLGEGVKCYATRHLNEEKHSRQLVQAILYEGVVCLLHAGCTVIREKIELVLHDRRH